jgi:hypothetical protein
MRDTDEAELLAVGDQLGVCPPSQRSAHSSGLNLVNNVDSRMPVTIASGAGSNVYIHHLEVTLLNSAPGCRLQLYAGDTPPADATVVPFAAWFCEYSGIRTFTPICLRGGAHYTITTGYTVNTDIGAGDVLVNVIYSQHNGAVA